MLMYTALKKTIQQVEQKLSPKGGKSLEENLSGNFQYQQYGEVEANESSEIAKLFGALNISTDSKAHGQQQEKGKQEENESALQEVELQFEIQDYFSLPQNFRQPFHAKFASLSASSDQAVRERSLRWGGVWEQLICMEYAHFISYAGNKIGSSIPAKELNNIILFRLLRFLNGLRLQTKKYLPTIQGNGLQEEFGVKGRDSFDARIQSLVSLSCEQALKIISELQLGDKGVAKTIILAIRDTIDRSFQEMENLSRLDYGLPESVFNMPWSARQTSNALQFSIIRGLKYLAGNFFTDSFARIFSKNQSIFRKLSSGQWMHDSDVAAQKAKHWHMTWKKLHDVLYNSHEEKDGELQYQEGTNVYVIRYKEIMKECQEEAKELRGSYKRQKERLEISYEQCANSFK